jgi:hypothetical protein
VVVVVVVATPGHVHLAVLMVPMPVAVEVPAIRVAVYMTMMMAVPVSPLDIDIMRQLHDPGLDRSRWLRRRSFGRRRGKCQGKTGARCSQCRFVRHEHSPLSCSLSVHAR